MGQCYVSSDTGIPNVCQLWTDLFKVIIAHCAELPAMVKFSVPHHLHYF